MSDPIAPATGPTHPRVRLEIREHVAHVALHRPDKRNALDVAMFQALIETGLRLRDEPDVRAVVLSGDGAGFCAGLDVSALGGSTPGTGLLAHAADSPANRAQRAAWIWQELPVPVIAAIHGFAFGGGLQIALGADLRYVAPDAKLCIMEIHWGLIPDMSGTQTLRHLVRLDVAKELTFTGRTVSGTEAVALGLATRVCQSPIDDALATAAEIAQRSPDAVRAAKRLLNASRALTLEQGLALEAELQRAMLASDAHREAVQARIAGRPPLFRTR